MPGQKKPVRVINRLKDENNEEEMKNDKSNQHYRGE